jgi:hypothetical protein
MIKTFCNKCGKGELKMGVRKAIPKATRLKVYEKYNGHCAYCGAKMDRKDDEK